MKLIQLEYFEAVCNYESINKASEELHVSQPAITKAIHQLETEFDIALFHRFGNRLSLTEEGEFFLRYSKDINTRVKLLENRMHERANNKCNIKMGIPPMIGAFMFPHIFKNFTDRFPNINLSVLEEGSTYIMNLVEDGTLDMGIVILNSTLLTQFNIVTMHDTEIVYCTNKSSRLSNAKCVSVTDIGDSPLILMKEGSYQNTIIRKLFSDNQLSPNIVMSSNQLFTIKKFIKDDIASAFLIKDVIDKQDDIKAIPLTDPLEIQIGLIWKKRAHLPGHALNFIRFIQRYGFDL